jgi:hypothetical protein
MSGWWYGGVIFGCQTDAVSTNAKKTLAQIKNGHAREEVGMTVFFICTTYVSGGEDGRILATGHSGGGEIIAAV